MPSTAVALPKLCHVIVPSSSGTTSASGQVLLSVSVARTLLAGPTSSGKLSAPATPESSATLMYKRSASSARLPDGCTRSDTLLIGMQRPRRRQRVDRIGDEVRRVHVVIGGRAERAVIVVVRAAAQVELARDRAGAVTETATGDGDRQTSEPQAAHLPHYKTRRVDIEGPTTTIRGGMDKTYTDARAALFDLRDGATILAGGFGLSGNPENCIRAIRERGVPRRSPSSPTTAAPPTRASGSCSPTARSRR